MKKIILTSGFLVFLIIFSAPVFSEPAEIDPRLQPIQKMMDAGDYDSAKTELDQRISEDPAFLEAYFQRGMLSLYRKETEAAMADFEHILEADQTHSLAYVGKASVFFQAQDLDGAIENLNRAIEYTPELGLAYYNRGIAYYYKEDYVKALEDLRDAMRFGVEVEEEIMNEVWAMSHQDEAIEALTEDINKDSNNAAAFYNRALLYYYRGEFGRAWADAQRAQKLGYDVPEDFLTEVKKLHETVKPNES